MKNIYIVLLLKAALYKQILQQRGFQAQNLSFKASIHNILRIFINYSLSILLLKSPLWLFLVLFYFQFHSKIIARRLTQYTG